MNSRNFQLLAALLRHECGFVIEPDKTYLAESRLAPIARQFGHSDVDALMVNIESTKSRESIRAVVESMVNHETFFFRDQAPFEHLERTALPELLAARDEKRQLRIWSAAASTGQEAYSIAMTLDQIKAQLDGWRIQILATDISERALKRAATGEYSQFEVQRGLPIKRLVQYFEPRGERWQVKQAVRKAVRFERFNLLSDPTQLGRFDVIFCRNVLMYLDGKAREKALKGVARQLNPGGFLYLGGAESLAGHSDAFVPDAAGRNVYRPADAAQRQALAG